MTIGSIQFLRPAALSFGNQAQPNTANPLAPADKNLINSEHKGYQEQQANQEPQNSKLWIAAKWVGGIALAAGVITLGVKFFKKPPKAAIEAAETATAKETEAAVIHNPPAEETVI